MGKTTTYQRPCSLNFRKEVRWQQISSKELKLLGEYFHNPAGVTWIYLYSRCILLHLSPLLDNSTLPNCQGAFCHCPPTTTAASVHGPPGGRSIADHSPRWPVQWMASPCRPWCTHILTILPRTKPCALHCKAVEEYIEFPPMSEIETWELERRGSRSKGYKWPLNPRSNTVHCTISIHILQHPGRQAQLTWSSQSPWRPTTPSQAS